MSIMDAAVGFVYESAPLSLVAAAGVAIPTNPIDLMGNGAGTTVTNIWGNSTLPFAPDGRGVGDPRPLIDILIGTALATGTSATLTPQLQGAPDDGSGGVGTYQTYAQGPVVTAAQGIAGRRIRMSFEPPFPITNRPRFLRLNFVVPAATLFTAGTVLSAQIVTTRDDWYLGQMPRNYTIGPLS